MRLEDHLVRNLKTLRSEQTESAATALSSAELQELALDCGAADVGFVETSRPALDPQRDELLGNYAWTKTFSQLRQDDLAKSQ